MEHEILKTQQEEVLKEQQEQEILNKQQELFDLQLVLRLFKLEKVDSEKCIIGGIPLNLKNPFNPNITQKLQIS